MNVGQPQDLYSAQTGKWASLTVPIHITSDGTHTVSYTVTGKNAASTSYIVGIDYLTLTQTNN
ncbi:hypothetical protein [Curtobacterium sp. MCJR17_020]|uniref:hypothetical protein n=1 Tax=Curtobacterium sp. MCJR17_020 TaxID=2175619 RepID=UPI000DA933DE|nr:hypothetical protein [Curtobacterium sp. MCJR17_020]WIE71604.1 hypothetical protein DEJ14_015655 [Curtobacterium sp. MCJR17_020]